MEIWQSAASVAYDAAVKRMENRVAAIAQDAAPETIWFLEHPSIYTAGTSARPEDLLRHDLPVYQTGRGGQYTYHGPGQRVVYVMCDLRRRGHDIRRFVRALETAVIESLSSVFAIRGEIRPGRVGIWIDLSRFGRKGEAKIAAIGLRVRRGVTYHGLSVNINPDLAAFEGIVPCGIRAHGVTSVADLLGSACPPDATDRLDEALRNQLILQLDSIRHGLFVA